MHIGQVLPRTRSAYTIREADTMWTTVSTAQWHAHECTLNPCPAPVRSQIIFAVGPVVSQSVNPNLTADLPGNSIKLLYMQINLPQVSR